MTDLRCPEGMSERKAELGIETETMTAFQKQLAAIVYCALHCKVCGREIEVTDPGDPCEECAAPSQPPETR